ncbi:reverse transcriptase-rnase h-integrase [Moniliophthora roreri]|nr:reverse transcriptase-rnase h-integrase [Moniliophthora roreri]
MNYFEGRQLSLKIINKFQEIRVFGRMNLSYGIQTASPNLTIYFTSSVQYYRILAAVLPRNLQTSRTELALNLGRVNRTP